MISNIIKATIDGLLSNWFLYGYYEHKNLEHGVLQCFLQSPSTFGVSMIPMYTVRTVLNTVSKVNIKSFTNTGIILTQKYSRFENITQSNRLFREWRDTGQWLYGVSFKGVNYYLGPGMLLDQNYKPLIMATCSIVTFKRKGVIHWYYHSPTVNLAPTLMADSVWRKFILDYFIPLCNQPIQAKRFCQSVPKNYQNVLQTVTVQIHDLSKFIVSVKTPELTEDLTEELTAEMQSLAELPQLI